MRKQQNIHPAIELAYYVPQAILGSMELSRRLSGKKPRRKRRRRMPTPVVNPRSLVELRQDKREAQSLNNHLQELSGQGFDSVFVQRNHPYYVIARQHPGIFDIQITRGGFLIALKGSSFNTTHQNPELSKRAKRAISRKISQLVREGYPHAQAVAVAYSEHRAGRLPNPTPQEWNDEWDADLEEAAKEGDKWLRSELGRGRIKPWRVSWYAPRSQSRVYLQTPVKAHTAAEAIRQTKVMIGANDKQLKKLKQTPVNFHAEQMPMEHLDFANPRRPSRRLIQQCFDLEQAIKRGEIVLSNPRISQRRAVRLEDKLFHDETDLEIEIEKLQDTISHTTQLLNIPYSRGGPDDRERSRLRATLITANKKLPKLQADLKRVQLKVARIEAIGFDNTAGPVGELPNPSFHVDATPALKAVHATITALTHGGAVRKVKRSLGKHKDAYKVKVEKLNPANVEPLERIYDHAVNQARLKGWDINSAAFKQILHALARNYGYNKKQVDAWLKAKQNPGAPAHIDDLARMFHGTVTGAAQDVIVSHHHRHNKHIQRIGRLPYIKMHNRPQGQQHASPKHACNACAIFFPRRTSWVSMNGSKRIILAGDGVLKAGQRLRKMALAENPSWDGEINLGRIEVMAYVTPEKHSNSGTPILYYHPHAEETGRVRDMPSLHIDRNGMLYIPERSGNYDIDERGIIN